MRVALVCLVGLLALMACLTMVEANLWTQKKKKEEEKPRSSFDSLLKAEKGGGKGGKMAKPKMGGMGAGGGKAGGLSDLAANADDMDLASMLGSLSDMDMTELMVQFMDEMINQLQQPEVKAMLEDPKTLIEVVDQLPANMRQGVDLSLLESANKDDPVKFKQDMNEMIDSWIIYMRKFKEALRDPAALKEMFEELLETKGMDEDTKKQLRQYIDDPEALLTEVMEAMGSTLGDVGNKASGTSMRSMIDELAKDPELAELFSGDPDELSNVMAELMKDPAFSKLMEAQQEL